MDRHYRRDGGVCYEPCETRRVTRVVVRFRPVMKTVRGGFTAKPQLVSESETFIGADVAASGDTLKVVTDSRTHNYPISTVAEWVTDTVDACGRKYWCSPGLPGR